MGIFSRRRDAAHVDESQLDDVEWLDRGRQRYERLISNHYGSPETIAHGGMLRAREGDLAAALFFFQKAVDLLQTHYCNMEMSERQPGPADEPILRNFIAALSEIRATRPGAPVRASVREVTHRLRTIATACQDHERRPGLYLGVLDELAAIAPDIDTDGIFWRNPTVDEILGRPNAGPSVEEVLAEWRLDDAEADLARWAEGMARYDAAELDNRPEIQAAAELMCPPLAHYVAGQMIFEDTAFRDAEVDLRQTMWNVLVASLFGNDASSWGPEVERRVRLALVATRKSGYQANDLGGSGVFSPLFEETGSRMLMAAALSPNPAAFDLAQWFARR